MEPPKPPPVASAVPQIMVTCPFCEASLWASPTDAGTAMPCAQCGGKFQVPIPTAKQASGAWGDHRDSPEFAAFTSKKVAAGVCGILIGGLGIHKFILGLNTAGAIMCAVWWGGLVSGMCVGVPLAASMAMTVIGFVEGLLYLTKSDEEFYQTYAVAKREWF